MSESQRSKNRPTTPLRRRHNGFCIYGKIQGKQTLHLQLSGIIVIAGPHFDDKDLRTEFSLLSETHRGYRHLVISAHRFPLNRSEIARVASEECIGQDNGPGVFTPCVPCMPRPT